MGTKIIDIFKELTPRDWTYELHGQVGEEKYITIANTRQTPHTTLQNGPGGKTIANPRQTPRTTQQKRPRKKNTAANRRETNTSRHPTNVSLPPQKKIQHIHEKYTSHHPIKHGQGT